MPKKFFSRKAVIVPITILLLGAAYSVFRLTRATTPNPGHTWTQIGNGTWQSADVQTTLRTFTFPDLNATVLTGSSTPGLLQQTITASTTLSTSTNASIFVNAAAAPITVTLPSATGTDVGITYFIKKIDASLVNQVTIAAQPNQTIDGVANISFANRGESAMLQSDGTNWRVVLRRSFDYNAFHTRGTSSTLQNQWYTTVAAGGALTTTTALTANTVYAMPLILTKITTIDQMSVDVVSSTAAGTMEVGIYNDTGNEFPGALAVDCGSQSPGSNGAKTYTTNLPVALDAGLYWMVVDSGTAVRLNQFLTANIIPILGYSSSTVTAVQAGWKATLTAGALPAAFPTTGSSTISSAPYPAIFVHFSG